MQIGGFRGLLGIGPRHKRQGRHCKLNVAFIHPTFEREEVISFRIIEREGPQMPIAEGFTQSKSGEKMNCCNILHILHGLLVAQLPAKIQILNNCGVNMICR